MNRWRRGHLALLVQSIRTALAGCLWVPYFLLLPARWIGQEHPDPSPVSRQWWNCSTECWLVASGMNNLSGIGITRTLARARTPLECVNNTSRTGKQWESRTKADNPSAGSPVESPDRGPQNQTDPDTAQQQSDCVDEPRQNPELAIEHYTDQDRFFSKHRRELSKLSKRVA